MLCLGFTYGHCQEWQLACKPYLSQLSQIVCLLCGAATSSYSMSCDMTVALRACVGWGGYGSAVNITSKRLNFVTHSIHHRYTVSYPQSWTLSPKSRHKSGWLLRSLLISWLTENRSRFIVRIYPMNTQTIWPLTSSVVYWWYILAHNYTK